MPTAMVTFNGRVTLPPNVIRQLKLRIGDSVDFVEKENGRFEIVPGPESLMDRDLLAPVPELDEIPA